MSPPALFVTNSQFITNLEFGNTSCVYFYLLFLAALGRHCCTQAFSNCGKWASLEVASLIAAHRLNCAEACGILVPGPGIEPASPASTGGFLTTGPSGKSPMCLPTGDWINKPHVN